MVIPMTANEPTKKYLVVPGYTISRNDGDRHYISAPALMRLYGVSPLECVVLSLSDRRLADQNLIVLRPRYDGIYELPGAEKDSSDDGK